MNAMIWTIIKREFLDIFISFRFFLSVLLCILLLLSSAYVSARYYEQRRSTYSEASQQLEFLGLTKGKRTPPVTATLMVYREPEVLSVFCHGVDALMGEVVHVSVYYPPSQAVDHGPPGFHSQSRAMEFYPAFPVEFPPSSGCFDSLCRKGSITMRHLFNNAER